MNYKIGIIGAGNIASCFVRGLAMTDNPMSHITISNPTLQKLERLKAEFAVNITLDNCEAVKDNNLIILAVKPHQLAEVALQIKSSLTSQQTIVSFINGVSLQQLENIFNGIDIIRAMPNINMQVAAGVTALFAPGISPSVKGNVTQLFSSIGEAIWVDDEKAFAWVLAVAGCGPAYWLELLHEMQLATAGAPLAEKDIHNIIKQTFIGVARLIDQQPQGFDELCQSVCSKGGSTEAALTVLQKARLKAVFSAMIDAAINRAQEISSKG